MAATNAYYAVARIPLDGGDVDDAVFTGTTQLASGNSAQFKLRGGRYGVAVHATFAGNVDLKVLAQDGSTWLKTITTLTADGYVTVDLIPGTYRVELS